MICHKNSAGKLDWTDVHIPVTEEVQEDDKEIVKFLIHTDETSSSSSKVQDFISAREHPQKRARIDT